VCNPGTAKCVQCLNDTQCSDPTPKCDGTTNTCIVNTPLPDAGAPDAGSTSSSGGVVDAGSDAGGDAGSSGSSGGVVTPDGGYGGDGGGGSSSGLIIAPPPDIFSVEGGGCGCRTVPSSNGFDRRLLAGLGLTALFIVRRRRGTR
jgi:hypothetical protein